MQLGCQLPKRLRLSCLFFVMLVMPKVMSAAQLSLGGA
jgi:hypothetical protein